MVKKNEPSKKEFGGSDVDISQRKQIEEMLRESDKKLRFLADNMHDILWTIDLNMHTTYVSPSIESALGFTQEERMKQDISEQITTASLAIAQDTLAREIQYEQSEQAELNRVIIIETEYYHKDGSTLWFENAITGIRDNKGILIGLQGLSRNITQRKRVEEALKQSEQRYRLLADNTTDYIWLMDMNLNNTYLSPSVLKRTGFTEQEMKESPIEQHIAPESLKLVGKIFVEELPKVQADPEYNPIIELDIEFYCKDGTTFWTENKFTVIRDGNGRPMSILGEARDITKLRRAYEKLKESEEKFRLIAELSTDAVYITDAQGQLGYVSPSAKHIFGYTAEEMTGHNFMEFLSSDSQEIALAAFSLFLSEQKRPIDIELHVKHKDGKKVTITLTAALLKMGNFIGTTGIIRDITQTKQALEDIQKSEKLYRLLAENITDVVWTMDMNMCVNYISPSVYSLQGYTPSEALALPFASMLTPDSLKTVRSLFIERVMNELGDTSSDINATFEAEFVRKDGSKFWAETRTTILRNDNGTIIGILGTTRDISERKTVEQQLKDLAIHDSLTGLTNRMLFYDRLNLAIAQAKRGAKELAVLMIDLDRFKRINDTLGHSIGDELLKGVAVILQQAIRTSDTVSRMGGDEFTILLSEIADVNKAIEVAQRILNDLRRPLSVRGHELNITSSIGIAIYPRDGKDNEDLLRKADIAMYASKRAGRDRYCLYSYSADKESPTF